MKRFVGLLAFGPALMYFALSCAPASGGSLDLDFNTDPADLGVQFTGNSEWRTTGGVDDSGYLKVTDAANGERGAIVFPDLENGAVVTGFTITADLRVGGGTDRPADGFSFNFARPSDPVFQDPIGEGWAASPGGEENLPEEGTTTGLGIGFDEWDSGGGDVVGMSVRVDNELVSQIELPTLNGALDDVTSLQTGPNTDGVAGLGWAPLEITLSTDKNLSISYKGNEVFNAPVDFAASAGQLVFGGRTGGANSNHHIDNISVTTVPEPGSLLIALTGLCALLGLQIRRRR